jgi:hypothetical protein
LFTEADEREVEEILATPEEERRKIIDARASVLLKKIAQKSGNTPGCCGTHRAVVCSSAVLITRPSFSDFARRIFFLIPAHVASRSWNRSQAATKKRVALERMETRPMSREELARELELLKSKIRTRKEAQVRIETEAMQLADAIIKVNQVYAWKGPKTKAPGVSLLLATASSAGRPLKLNCCQLVIATGKTFPSLAWWM